MKSISDDSLSSIHFGKRVLEVPRLEEVDIQIGGVGIVTLPDDIKQVEYGGDVGGIWVDRGDLILTYTFILYNSPKKSLLSFFFGDPFTAYKYEIKSPISGLLVGLRKECGRMVSSSVGLSYQFYESPALPLILIPNDEPIPDTTNFVVYEQMRHHLLENYHLLKTRNPDKIKEERLGDIINQSEDKNAPKDVKELGNNYKQMLDQMENYKKLSAGYSYKSRELSEYEYNIIKNIEKMRSSSMLMRDKLVHISREFAEQA